MQAMEKLNKRMDLTFEETRAVFDCMLDGRMEEAEIEHTLVCLADKGEAEQEIAGAATALLAHAIRLEHTFDRLLDTCWRR